MSRSFVLTLSVIIFAALNLSAKNSSPAHEFKTVKTNHSISINGKELKYTVYTGILPIYSDDSRHIANMSYIAYFKNVPERTKRPISFIYNGGPGAASSDINFLGTGPEIFKMQTTDNNILAPRKPITANNESWLEFTDEVYIDAPGTGFGSILKNEYQKDICGIEQDAVCFGKFIYSFLDKYKRFSSPLFLAGESYGAVRTVHLTEFLIEKYSIFPRGIVLIGPLVSTLTLPELGEPGNNIPFATQLPTLTIAAYYHKKLDKTLLKRPIEDIISEVKEWSMTEYFIGLNNYRILSEKDNLNLQKKLSKYTGLSQELIKQYNSRIPGSVFAESLLQKDDSTISYYDTRFYQYNKYYHEQPKCNSNGDPFFHNSAWLKSSLMYNYFQNNLKITTGIPYKNHVSFSWIWQNQYMLPRSLNILPDIYDLITEYPELKFFVANGYYEFGFPYFGTEYLLNQLNLPEKLQDNIQHKTYWSGHLIYIDQKARKELFNDLTKFYSYTLKSN